MKMVRLITAFALLVAALGAVLVLLNMHSGKAATASVPSAVGSLLKSPSPLRSLLPQSVSSTQTYRDASGFSFQYPRQWTLAPDPMIAGTVSVYPPGNFTGPAPEIGVSLLPTPYTPDPTYPGVRDVQPISVGGVTGRRFVTVGGVPYDSIIVELPFKGRTLQIEASITDAKDGSLPDMKPTFETILSSLHLE